MNKTVASVIDEIGEFESKHGTIWYVTCMFTDDSVGSVGKKTNADAITVHNQLRDAIGEELDFTVEDGGTSGSGRQKWKIKGFGPPGGEPTYTAPGIQGDGASPRGQTSGARGARSPEHDQDRDASIRAAVALKAAASFLSMTAVSSEKVLEVAEFFEEWLQRKASEPASSAYKNDLSVVTPPAGAGSEQSSPAAGPPAESRDMASQDGVATKGEGSGETGGSSSSPPGPSSPAGGSREGGSVDELPTGEPVGEASASPPHVHDYQLRQGLKGFLVCEGCGKTRKKETA